MTGFFKFLSQVIGCPVHYNLVNGLQAGGYMVVEKLQSCMIGRLATLWLSTTVGILILGDGSLGS